MRRFMVFVPAFCTFGPLEMVIGYETPYHLLSLVAALVTSIGILIIFANVMQLIKERDFACDSSTSDLPKNTAAIVVSAAIGLVIVAGGAFFVITGAHR